MVENIVKSQQATINALNETITEKRQYINKLLREKADKHDVEIKKQQELQKQILQKHEQMLQQMQQQLQLCNQRVIQQEKKSTINDFRKQYTTTQNNSATNSDT